MAMRKELFCLIVCVMVAGCKGAKPAADIRLEKGTDGQVTSATLVGRNVTDADIAEIAKNSQQLTELRLQECSQVTSQGLKAIEGAFPNLKLLDLVRVPVDDGSLAYLANSATLADVTLAHTNITGTGLKHLASCPLKRLVIFSHVVTADGMKNLAALQTLEEVELHCQELPLKEFSQISQLKNLKKLVAFRTPVGPQGIESVKGLSQLEYLHLNSPDINDQSVATINTLSNLEWAEFDYGTLTNDGIKRLQLPKLKQLSLDGCKGVTDEGLGNFAGMPALESLMLGSTGVAGIDLTPLANLPNLKEVKLMGNQFRGGDKAIQDLKAKLPKCEVFIMQG
jgi:Leucine-rich repeat (LRR) protein